MKIFAVYLNVRIESNSEEWIEFMKKYHQDNFPHITLKQSCYVEEKQILDIKKKLAVLFETLGVPDHKIGLFFSEILVDKYPDETSLIMAKAEPLEKLRDLQRKVIDAMASYNNYLKSELKQYEDNFIPHITLAQDLDSFELELAMKDLNKLLPIKGFTESATLVIVDQVSMEEAKNPDNLTIYRL